MSKKLKPKDSKYLGIIFVITVICIGCSSSEHYCDSNRSGIILRGNYGEYTSGSRPLSHYACLFKANGTITNTNDFAVRMVRYRNYWRQRDVIDLIILAEGETRKIAFTGSDKFIIKDANQNEIGVLSANVIFIDRRGRTHIHKD